MRRLAMWMMILSICLWAAPAVIAQEADAEPKEGEAEATVPAEVEGASEVEEPAGEPAEAEEAEDDYPTPTKCTMKFSMKHWSAFYKSGKGEGVITCDNGQTQRVKLKSKGGGITAGKGEIRKGKGSFSEVYDISDLYGGYAVAEASAGAGKSAGAQVVTKGEISLALSGIGTGVELGFSFGKFTIKPRD